MNLTHDHIHHPKLGDIPTNGNRFQAVLDAARTAGLACERAYDALTAGPRPGEPAGQVSQ